MSPSYGNLNSIRPSDKLGMRAADIQKWHWLDADGNGVITPADLVAAVMSEAANHGMQKPVFLGRASLHKICDTYLKKVCGKSKIVLKDMVTDHDFDHARYDLGEDYSAAGFEVTPDRILADLTELFYSKTYNFRFNDIEVDATRTAPKAKSAWPAFVPLELIMLADKSVKISAVVTGFFLKAASVISNVAAIGYESVRPRESVNYIAPVSEVIASAVDKLRSYEVNDMSVDSKVLLVRAKVALRNELKQKVIDNALTTSADRALFLKEIEVFDHDGHAFYVPREQDPTKEVNFILPVCPIPSKDNGKFLKWVEPSLGGEKFALFDNKYCIRGSDVTLLLQQREQCLKLALRHNVDVSTYHRDKLVTKITDRVQLVQPNRLELVDGVLKEVSSRTAAKAAKPSKSVGTIIDSFANRAAEVIEKRSAGDNGRIIGGRASA